MGYYLYDTRGFVGDLASNRGLIEMRNFLCETDSVFNDFFEMGFTLNTARLWVLLSVTESDDEMIDDTIVNLRDHLKKCKDIAIISDAAETEEEVARKKEVKKKYVLPRGKRHNTFNRCRKALELYRPWGRKAQDFAYHELAELAKEMEAEMTRGTHPFDLILGENVIDFQIRLPDKLIVQEFMSY